MVRSSYIRTRRLRPRQAPLVIGHVQHVPAIVMPLPPPHGGRVMATPAGATLASPYLLAEFLLGLACVLMSINVILACTCLLSGVSREKVICKPSVWVHDHIVLSLITTGRDFFQFAGHPVDVLYQWIFPPWVPDQPNHPRHELCAGIWKEKRSVHYACGHELRTLKPGNAIYSLCLREWCN